MPITWGTRESILRLLAAVYAVLGENAFDGKMEEISRLYQFGVTSDEVKAEFTEVIWLAQTLVALRPTSPFTAIEVGYLEPSKVDVRPIQLHPEKQPVVIIIDDDEEDSFGDGLKTPHSEKFRVLPRRSNQSRKREASASVEIIKRARVDSLPMTSSKQNTSRIRIGAASCTKLSSVAESFSGPSTTIRSHVEPAQNISLPPAASNDGRASFLADKSAISYFFPSGQKGESRQAPRLETDGGCQVSSHLLLNTTIGPESVSYETPSTPNFEIIEIQQSGIDISTFICTLCSLRFKRTEDIKHHYGRRLHRVNLGDEELVARATARAKIRAAVNHYQTNAEKLSYSKSVKGKERASTVTLADEDNITPAGITGKWEFYTANDSTQYKFEPRYLPSKLEENTRPGIGRDVQTPEQMSFLLQDKQFKRSKVVQVFTALKACLTPALVSSDVILDRLSMPHHAQIIKSILCLMAKESPSSAQGLCSKPRNIWIIDTEFASLNPDLTRVCSVPEDIEIIHKRLGGLYGFSVNLINFLTGEEIVNHRLQLPIPRHHFLNIIRRLGSPAIKQYKAHWQDSCALPIISPLALANLLGNAGFKPEDYLFHWSIPMTDHKVLRNFLSGPNCGLEERLLPPRDPEHVVSLLCAWKRLLPGFYSHALANLFKFVYPNSNLNGTHHVAQVDNQKLGMMTWKLLELNYDKIQTQLPYGRIPENSDSEIQPEEFGTQHSEDTDLYEQDEQNVEDDL